MPERELAVEGVTVEYGPPNARMRALNGVSLDFTPGTVTLVMGPSGSGKTTLLSLLGCLLRPDEGRVFFGGGEMNRLTERQLTDVRRKNIGFIFQAFRLFHSLSALDNVLISADVDGGRNANRREAATAMLQDLGLCDKMSLKPAALSGGEKQRVAIARALLPNPRVILADEPTASLDSAAGRQICGILRRLATERRHTTVVVSHDPRWMQFADRTVVLEDGRVVDDRRNMP